MKSYVMFPAYWYSLTFYYSPAQSLCFNHMLLSYTKLVPISGLLHLFHLL